MCASWHAPNLIKTEGEGFIASSAFSQLLWGAYSGTRAPGHISHWGTLCSSCAMLWVVMYMHVMTVAGAMSPCPVQAPFGSAWPLGN